MTDLEQEALSHQHSHGVWVVALPNDLIAVFDHPNGKLLKVTHILALGMESIAASERWQSRKQTHKFGPQLDLPELDLDGIDL